MKRYTITETTLEKIESCLSEGELEQLSSQIDNFCSAISSYSLIQSLMSCEDSKQQINTKKVLMLSLFCREHIEEIQQLIRNIELGQETEE